MLRVVLPVTAINFVCLIEVVPVEVRLVEIPVNVPVVVVNVLVPIIHVLVIHVDVHIATAPPAVPTPV